MTRYKPPRPWRTTAADAFGGGTCPVKPTHALSCRREQLVLEGVSRVVLPDPWSLSGELISRRGVRNPRLASKVVLDLSVELIYRSH